MTTKEQSMQHQTHRKLSLLTAAVVLGAFVALFGLLGSAQATANVTGSIQQDANPASDGEKGERFYGVLTAEPPTDQTEPWEVDGQTYTATASTEFNTAEFGPFELNGCVKVELVLGSTTELRQIETQSASDCQKSGDDDHGDGDDGPEIYGFVVATPTTGLTGTWTISNTNDISGTDYTATDTTKFEMEYGPLEVGACVEAYLLPDGTNTMTKLESKPAYKCDRSNDDSDDGDHSVGEPIIGKGELYGEIVSFPTDVLTGTWMIKGLDIPIIADSRTEFSQEKGAFAEGALIKVEFVVLSDDTGTFTFLAREIKSALSPSFGDDDDHEGDDHHDGYKREGHAYGAIKNIEGEIWSIGGMTYTVNANTELHSEGLTFGPGVMVKVEYKVDADGNRIAKEIEAKGMGDGSSSGDTGELYGFVTGRPTSSYLGTWTIGGLVCKADNSTRFEQEHGTLDGSPFAEVKYVMQDGNCLITKLETHVPPGGGDKDFAGPLEKKDDMSGITAAAANVASVTVGGQDFTVTAATQMSAGLVEGETVVVNSWVDANGNQIATRITAVNAVGTVYMPLLVR